VKSISVSLDDEVVKTLTMAARRLGVSRSAFINTILGQSRLDIEKMIKLMPDEGEDMDPRRFRGAAIDIITEQYKDLVQEVINFPDEPLKGTADNKAKGRKGTKGKT
jgi:hypothetical protein